MRSRLSLVAALVCLLVLASTSWAYNRPYVIHDENVSTGGTTGGTLDDHPWGEDQSIANPNTGGTTTTVGVRQRVSAISKAERVALQMRLYFINMLIRWTHPENNVPTDAGTTNDVVPMDNTTTVKGGVQ